MEFEEPQEKQSISTLESSCSSDETNSLRWHKEVQFDLFAIDYSELSRHLSTLDIQKFQDGIHEVSVDLVGKMFSTAKENDKPNIHVEDTFVEYSVFDDDPPCKRQKIFHDSTDTPIVACNQPPEKYVLQSLVSDYVNDTTLEIGIVIPDDWSGLTS